MASYLGARKVPASTPVWHYYEASDSDPPPPETIWVWEPNSGDCVTLDLPPGTPGCSGTVFDGKSWSCGSCQGYYSQALCNFCKTNYTSPITSVELRNESTGYAMGISPFTTQAGSLQAQLWSAPEYQPANYAITRVWPTTENEIPNERSSRVFDSAVRIAFLPEQTRRDIFLSNFISPTSGYMVLQGDGSDQTLFFIRLIPPS